MPQTKYILSDQSKNSHGFILLTSGIDFKTRFEKNPVMLLNHNANIVLGKWNNLTVDNDMPMAAPEFDQDDAEAMKYSKKAEKGYLNGVSLGIIPIEFKVGVPGFPEDCPVCTRSMAVECSLTPIPSNGNALKLYDTELKLMSDTQVSEFIQLSINNNQNPIPDMKNLALIIATLGMAVNSTEEAVVERIKAMVDEMTTLKNQIKDAFKLKVEALVDGAIAAKKLLSTSRDQYIKLATADYETTKALIDSMKPVLPLSGKLNNGGAETGDGKEKNSRDNWTWDDWQKKDDKALLSMRTSDPGKYWTLFDAHYKTNYAAKYQTV